MNNVSKRKRRRKYKIVNKFKFVRFIISCILLILLISYLISTVIDVSSTSYDVEDNILEVKDLTTDAVEVIEMVDEDSDINAMEYSYDNEFEDIYLMKPDALNDTYFEQIIEISNNEEIPLEVILTIMTIENETYNVNATCSNTNGTVDMGLCQINSAYVDYFADKYDIENLDPYNVEDAVTFVARHIKYLSTYGETNYDLSEFDSYVFAAGAYNRGLSNECKYRNMYSYKEKFINTYNTFV